MHDTKRDNNELHADWALRAEARDLVRDEEGTVDYDDAHTLAVDMTVERQAADLRNLAHAIESTGIPLMSPALEIGYKWAGDDRELARRGAKVGVEFLKALGYSIEKINSEHYWGVRSELPSGIRVQYSIINTATCETVPVLDEDNNPVMETVSKLVSVDVLEAVTEKKCMSIFGKDEGPTV